MVHRITGPHLFGLDTGAAIWGNWTVEELEEILKKISIGAAQMSMVIQPVIHHHKTGQVIVCPFPCDVLYTACDFLEWAIGDIPEFEGVFQQYLQEVNIQWRDLKDWAVQQQIPVFDDEDGLTLGTGQYSQTWPLDQLPKISELEPQQFQKVPTVYITGTNGKTTTTRMLASIARQAHFQKVGMTSTDGVLINQEYLSEGDWTGPGAARQILRHPEVDFAILETARGGMMRRGLVMANVDAAAITNVSQDHLGKWGLHSVADMAMAKLTVAYGISEKGVLVLNANCEALVSAWNQHPLNGQCQVCWFSTNAAHRDQVDIWLDGNHIVHHQKGVILDITKMPLSLNGCALYNVENAMAAIALAFVVGISIESIKQGLYLLSPNQKDSQGRSNWLQLNGADIILDFAHNPDGIQRLVELGMRWNAQRTFIILGQAGDRSDDHIGNMAQAAIPLNAQQYLLKELPKHAYEREPFEVVRLMREALIAAGIDEGAIVDFKTEQMAAEYALSMLQKGDLLLLLSHEELKSVIPMLESFGAQWVHHSQ